MNTLKCTAALVFVFLCAGGVVLAADSGTEPGYVDLEWIKIPPDAKEIQDIDLGPILMSLADDAEEKGDDALVEAIAMIHGVRVKSFSVDEGGDASAAAAVEKIQATLNAGDWKRLLYRKDGDETIAVHTLYQEKDMVGLMIVMYEPGDSVAFINVLGDLNLGTMMRLAKRIDHDNLEEILEEYGDMDGVHVEIHDD